MDRVRARDVVPHCWGLWSSVMDDKPFVNPICHVKWSEDGSRLWFMLESFNFYSATPDQMLDLVPIQPGKYIDMAAVRAEHADVIKARPQPSQPPGVCPHCNGTGKTA